MELIVIFLLTIICYPVISLGDGALRITLGIIFLLIFPGYTMMAALFPARNSIKNIERATFTIVLSLVLVTLVGLILNFSPWGIRLTPIYIGVSIVIVLASGIAFFRRSVLPEAERFTLFSNVKMPKRGHTSKYDLALYICLGLVVIGAISTLVFVIARPKAQEPFSNFYVLGAEDMMRDYPRELTLGEQTMITLGIENHENQDTSYNVLVTLDGKETQSIGPILLTDEGKWSNEVTLNPSKAGDNQKVEFMLYKGDDPAPYLALHLWLDVK